MNRAKFVSLAAAGLAAALVMGACSSSKTGQSSPTSGGSSASTAKAPSGTPISIGLIASLTGAQASSSDQGATVAPAWADWINANGGINGHPVKLTFLDDKGDPAAAQAAGTQLINDGVAAIVVSSDNLVAAFDSQAIAKGIPLVGGPSDEPDWYTKAGMFPTMTGIVAGLGGQVGVAAKFGHAKSFANLYCSEVAACAQANPVLSGAAKSAGLGYTQLAVSSTAPSYTAQCIQLQQGKADYAQLNFTTSAAAKFVKDCQAQGFNPTWGTSEQAIGSSLLSIPNFTAYGPAFAFPSVADAPPAAQFRSVMQKYAKSDNWHEGTASFTWDGLQVIAKAIEDANVPASSPVTAQNVVTGLYSFKSENLAGELANGLTYTQGKAVGFTFNPCYFVVGVQGGKTTAPAQLTPQCPSA